MTDQPAGTDADVGEGREQGVVVAAAEDELQRVGAERGADRVQRLGDVERRRRARRSRRRSRRRGARPRRAARRRRRSSRSRRPRRRPGRRRTAAPGAGRPRPAPAASGSRGPGRRARRPPSPAGRRARGRRPARAPERSTGASVHAPSTVTAITTWSARVRSPPTTLAPTSAHSSAKPRAKSSAHCTGRSAGRGEPDGQRGRAAAHRVDVGQVLRGGPVPDVLGGGPVAAEVPALDHQVGRDDHVPGAHPQHGGVVAGTDQHLLALREQVDERRDQPELPGVGQGGVGRERCGSGHGPIPPDAGPGRPTATYRHAQTAR